MKDNILDILKDIQVGNIDSTIEQQRHRKFSEDVFVHNDIIGEFLDKDVFMVGGKGSGKTRIYLHLKSSHPRFREEEQRKVNLLFSFLNLEDAYSASLAEFDKIASQVYERSQDRDMSVIDAFKVIDENIVKVNWYHIMAYAILEDINKAIYEKELRLRDYRMINDYLDAYNIAPSKKPLDKIPDLFTRIKSHKRKYKIVISGSEIVSEKEGVLDPLEVLKEIDRFLAQINTELYLIIDNPDRVLGITKEDVTVCLLGTFFSLVVGWRERFLNIYLKILTRADLPIRADFGGKNKITDKYSTIIWSKRQFLILILKRLLYSIKLRKAIGVSGSLPKLDLMEASELVEVFLVLFGQSKYRLPLCSLPGRERNAYGAETELGLDEFLYLFFLDGKRSIPIRHVITLLRLCQILEIKNRQNHRIHHELTRDNPLFFKETIDQAFKILPGYIYKQLDNEYGFIGKKFGNLAELCGRDFERGELLRVLETMSEDPYRALSALFYSGIIGGDQLLEEQCSKFYLPAFVQHGLLYGKKSPSEVEDLFR